MVSVIHMQMSSSLNLLRYEHFAFFLKLLFSPVVKMACETKQSVCTFRQACAGQTDIVTP